MSGQSITSRRGEFFEAIASSARGAHRGQCPFSLTQVTKAFLIHLNFKATLMGTLPSRQGARKMAENYRSNAEQLVEGAERAARSYWPLLIVEGIALILFGVLAVFIPPLITIGIASSLGWMFVFGGIATLFVYFRLYRTQAFRQRLFLAVLSVIAGVALLVRPLSGIISLTVVLIVGFAVIGAAKLTYPLERSRYFSNYQGWMRASGVVDLMLAAWMFADLPATAVWAPGLLLGANMILGGIALIVIALLERRKARQEPY